MIRFVPTSVCSADMGTYYICDLPNKFFASIAKVDDYRTADITELLNTIIFASRFFICWNSFFTELDIEPLLGRLRYTARVRAIRCLADQLYILQLATNLDA